MVRALKKLLDQAIFKFSMFEYSLEGKNQFCSNMLVDCLPSTIATSHSPSILGSLPVVFTSSFLPAYCQCWCACSHSWLSCFCCHTCVRAVVMSCLVLSCPHRHLQVVFVWCYYSLESYSWVLSLVLVGTGGLCTCHCIGILSVQPEWLLCDGFGSPVQWLPWWRVTGASALSFEMHAGRVIVQFVVWGQVKLSIQLVGALGWRYGWRKGEKEEVLVRPLEIPHPLLAWSIELTSTKYNLVAKFLVP